MKLIMLMFGVVILLLIGSIVFYLLGDPQGVLGLGCLAVSILCLAFMLVLLEL
jgi:hypothetical protein